MKKKIWKILLVLALMCIGIRIYFVNQRAAQPNYEYYTLGEWLEYDESYMLSANENTKGYSVRVLEASLMSYKEYMEKYNFPLDTLVKNYEHVVLEEDIDDIYNLSIIDVKFEFKNDSSEDGYIALSETKIFAEGDNISYKISEPLLDLQEPSLAGGMGYFFSLLPNGESIILNVPYILPVYSSGYIGQETGKSPKSLILTQAPIYKCIEIPLEWKYESVEEKR